MLAAKKKDLPAAAEEKRGEVLRLDVERAAIATCATPEEARAGAAKARFWESWAKEQRKLLRGATVAEALDAWREAKQLERDAAEAKLLWTARLGELNPPMDLAEAGASGGRPEKAVTAGDGFSPEGLSGAEREELRKARQVFAARDRIVDYLKHVDAEGKLPSRAGLVAFASASEKAEATNERREADAEPGPRPVNEDKLREAAAEEPGGGLNPFAKWAARLEQLAAEMKAHRLANMPPPLLKGRDERVKRLETERKELDDLGVWFREVQAENERATSAKKAAKAKAAT